MKLADQGSALSALRFLGTVATTKRWTGSSATRHQQSSSQASAGSAGSQVFFVLGHECPLLLELGLARPKGAATRSSFRALARPPALRPSLATLRPSAGRSCGPRPFDQMEQDRDRHLLRYVRAELGPPLVFGEAGLARRGASATTRRDASLEQSVGCVSIPVLP